jgi:hypothetical protein
MCLALMTFISEDSPTATWNLGLYGFFRRTGTHIPQWYLDSTDCRPDKDRRLTEERHAQEDSRLDEKHDEKGIYNLKKALII